MTSLFALQTIFEILLVAAVIWGIFNEERLASLEKRLFACVRRRRLKVIKGGSNRYSKAS